MLPILGIFSTMPLGEPLYWTTAVGGAILAGAPVPGTRIIFMGTMGASATRVLQKLLRTYKGLDKVVQAKEAFEETVKKDKTIPSKICKGKL